MNSQFLKHLKFLLTATNQHGVHSPFVFNYVTKCLYLERVSEESKTIDVLRKSISYFKAQNLQILGNDSVKGVLSKNFPELTFDQAPFDLMFIENLHPNLLSGLLSERKIQNGSMLLINSVHKNEKVEQLWKQLVADPRARVTLDLFYCGAVFFRREQAKEHFKIRI